MVDASRDLIKKARELEALRKISEKIELPTQEISNVSKALRVLEMKMDMLNTKLDKLLKEKELIEFKDVHQRILNMLDTWVSTLSIANALNYRQEYVSRKIAELKKMSKVQERRTGKNVYYKRTE